MSPKDGKAGTLIAPQLPTKATAADDAEPGDINTVTAEQRALKTGKFSSTPTQSYHKPSPAGGGGGAGAGATADDAPVKPKSFVGIKLSDADGNPVAGERYKLTLPDGKVDEGTTGADGTVKVEGIDPGSCKISFPDLNDDAVSAG